MKSLPLSTPYHHIKNHRSRDLYQTPEHPSTYWKKCPVPKNLNSKEDFRQWYSSATTNHCFLSLVEPLRPSQRVMRDNPPRRIHGFIADFDAAVEWAKLENRLLKKCGGEAPTYYARTRSDHLRLIWEFENPVTTDGESAEIFLRGLARELKVESVHAGYDKTSTHPSQYFEIGSDWKPLGGKLSEPFVFHIHATHFRVPKEKSVSIPFDIVAKEIEKQYRHRLNGVLLEIGARVPLFWIDDGVNRIGGQVCEEGVICYSDRAGTPFTSWEEILGRKFVREFRERKLHDILGDTWTDGKYYWITNENRPPFYETKENFITRLTGMGLSMAKPKGKNMSEISEAIFWVNTQRRVDGVGPFIFSPERIVDHGGKRILNTSFIKPTAAAENGETENWPFLNEFFNRFFSPVKGAPFSQLDVFLSWFQRFYHAITRYKKLSGHVMIISGPTGRGKTLLSHRIVGAAVGGHAPASDYLMGRTMFNKALSEAPLWTVDDTTSACSFADNRRFTEMLKRAAANPTVESHAKFFDAQEVEWLGRVMISLNEDPHSLTVVPQLDQSNMDKIIGLQVSQDSVSDFGGDNDHIEKTISRELPFFLHWLDQVYVPPQDLLGGDRYGIKSWFHPVLQNAARDNSPIKVVMETIDLFCKLYRACHPDKIMWQGTVAELLGDMSMMPEITSRNGTIEHERMHRQLKALEESRKMNPDIREMTSFSTGAGTLWVINLDSKFDLRLEESRELATV